MEGFVGYAIEMAIMTDRSEDFVRQMTRHEPRVYAFIRALVANWADAEEVLQETNATLWRKREEAAEARDFAAWACGVARIEVLRLRQRHKRDRLQFTDQFIETVAQQMSEIQDAMDDRRQALAACLQQLPAADRDLIERRYQQGARTRDIAAAAHRSVNAVQKALARVRRALLICVERRISGEGVR